MNIFISAVGNRDPFAEDVQSGKKTCGPILTACEALKPEIVFLLPTLEQPDSRLTSTEQKAMETREELRKKNIKVYIKPLDLPDPTDYEKIIRLFQDAFLSIKEQFSRSKIDYLIGLSSGTPQMHAAFMVLANSGKIKARLYQVIEPRYAKQEQERIRPVFTQFMEEENIIARARNYFDKWNFEVAGQELVGLALQTYRPEREKRAEIFSDICTGYDKWDKYQHKEALLVLQKVAENIKRFKELAHLVELLANQLGILNRIIHLGNHEGYENMLDLYHNARRRMDCGQYVDSLGRFKRLLEGCMFYCARKELSVYPDKKIGSQPEWVKGSLSGRYGYMGWQGINTLYENKMGKKLIPQTLLSELEEFSNQRNDTIIAHGMLSVEQKDAGRALKLIEKLFINVFKQKDLDQYPFAKDALRKAGELMFANL